MTSLECARAAFAVLCENSPANHCRLEGSVLDAGKEVPGGWSSARTLTEGLYGGKAIVNVSQQRLGEEQVPTVEILCDDPVLASESFTSREGLVGLQEADGAWALAYGENAGGARGNVVLAVPASLCAVVVEAAAAVPRAVSYLLEQGVPQEEILWGWSCCPVVLPSLDGEAVRAAHRAAIAAHGVCSIWVRSARADLETLARTWGDFRLRLHCLEDGKTYGAVGRMPAS